MDKTSKQLTSIFIRYVLLIILAFPNFWIFYFVLTPITLYLTYFSLNLFFDVALINNFIILEDILPIELIKACIAGSAYYLLLIFNLSIPKIKIKKRIKMILFAFGLFLILNVLRIFLLTLIYMHNPLLFNITHKLFWYLVSIVFVVGIWFIEVKLFKIKEIPFYSDFKFLYKHSTLKK